MSNSTAILIGAAGTWLIAVLALTQRLGPYFFRPKLTVEADGFSGTLATHNNGLKARYFLMRVRNPRRIPAAHDVQLVIFRIEKSGEHGPEILFDEVIPLLWIRHELNPLLTRTIGPDALAALFYIQENGALAITPAVGPGGSSPIHFPRDHQQPVTLSITLRAIAMEVDSRSIRLKIEWKGPWRAGKAEIEAACRVSLDPS